MNNPAVNEQNNIAIKNDQYFEEETIDLREYWSVIRRHIWGIVGLTIAITLLAIVVAFSIAPTFQANTTILLESKEANVVSIEEVYGINAKSIEYYYSQLEIIKSRTIAERVVQKLNLTTHPIFDPRQQPEPVIKFSLTGFIKDLLPESLKREPEVTIELTEEEKEQLKEQEIFQSVTSKVMAGLSISEHKQSLVVSISFSSKSPEAAAKISTEIANAYIESGFEGNLQMTQKAVGWLTERLSGLKDTLDKSEQKLIEYRKQENLLDVKGIQTISAKELDDISDKLSDARRERTKLQSVYNQIRQVKNPSIVQYESIPGILDKRSVQHAKDSYHDAQNSMAELSKRYGPKHPQMQSASANHKKAQNNYLRILQSVARGIESQYRAARSTESSLKRDMGQSKTEIRKINTKGFKLKELERDVETNRQLYETFFTRFKETSETSGMQSANARIIDTATIPASPIKPKKNLMVAVALIFGLGLGVILAFLKESLSNTLCDPADIEAKLSVPLLGILPLQKLKKSEANKPLLEFHNENKSDFSEAIRSIRTGVVLSGLDSDYKIAVITSSIPNEGKTTVSLNLALAVAQTERVLLIDADLRKPSIAKACGFESKNGLSSLVAGTADFRDCVRHFEEWNMDIMPSGIIPPNPQELL
ncbi:MAG: polysaccharide biosynthesis tyrosine autokinase, partial [Gammaproteobacteria bacterium]|nr:polysaccharide biosynthesis tyrosine autokinase [Gammaproteobacteria bacterium]